jgi:hypothetical protein
VTAVDFDASITNGVFTTAPGNAPLAVAIPIASIVIVVLIHDPVISFTHTDHANVTNGTIAGVLDTNEFIAAFDAIVGELSASLCGSAKTGVDDQFRQASDILVDGTNKPGRRARRRSRVDRAHRGPVQSVSLEAHHAA